MAASYLDDSEARPQELREIDLFGRLPGFLQHAVSLAPGLARWLEGIDLAAVNSREKLALLPVLRKDELLEMQAASPPFGGFADVSVLAGSRIYVSPGPIFEPQGLGVDPWMAARAFFAAGARRGDLVHNSFAYHMTPGGFVLDYGARALGCTVFAAGVGNTEMQVDAAAVLKPRIYAGTPDFLKTLLDRAGETGKDLSSLKLGLVSGGALFPSMRAEYRQRGVNVLQCYATAEFGVIAYESADETGAPNPGMIVNEDLIVEIVRPGTGDPVAEGEVGEVVVTCFNPAYPLVRLGTGDLSAILPGTSPCGRTNLRIKGWMGRADQRTKVKGMFVDPRQIAEIVRRHTEIQKARLVVSRKGAADEMTLHIESKSPTPHLSDAIAATLRDVTKLGGVVIVAETGSLPNDGKVIADDRDYKA